VILGDGVGLWEAQAIDDYESDEIREAARAGDVKGDWSSIPSADLAKSESSLSFFDPSGMRFHIPAFMLAELDGHLRMGFTVISLTNVYDDYGLHQWSGLSPDQRAAVHEFLKVMMEHEEYKFESESIERAIKEYWAR
jgi:hypothetical protein